MRKIKILKINPTATSGTIEVGGDVTNIFQGKFYRNPITGERLPSTTTPAPAFPLIKATTFDIVENAKYLGRYTVYTPVSGDVTASSVYNGTTQRTTIKVNELLPSLSAEDAASLASDGYLTNISTYLIDTGTEIVIVPPTVNLPQYPIELLGRDSVGWGEVFNQNFVELARNFAQDEPPENPFVGQTWYDLGDQQIRVFNGGGWKLINQASFGTTYRHTQGTATTTWVVNHFLGLAAPYIAFVQFFVDRGDGPKMIIPSDVTFNDANRLTVTFSNPEVGYVLVRQ